MAFCNMCGTQIADGTATCAACALRAQCTTSSRGRRISRSLDEAAVECVQKSAFYEELLSPTEK